MKITPFLGNLSGKLAGNVFARGKGGAYVRQFVPPVQPKSPAQIRARIAFANGSRAWSLLSASAKSAWNSFAQSSFSPKNPKPGVTYSGASAYSSFLNQCNSVNAAKETDQKISIGATTVNLIDSSYQTSTTPPSGKFSGQVYSGGLLTSAPLSLESLSLQVGPTSSCNLGLGISGSGIDPATFTLPEFVDQVTGEPFGFAIYTSSRIPSGTTKPAQVQKQLFAMLNPIEVAPADGPIEEPNWLLWFMQAQNLTDSKYQLSAGDVVTADVFAISKSGASVLIGSKEVTLT